MAKLYAVGNYVKWDDGTNVKEHPKSMLVYDTNENPTPNNPTYRIRRVENNNATRNIWESFELSGVQKEDNSAYTATELISFLDNNTGNSGGSSSSSGSNSTAGLATEATLATTETNNATRHTSELAEAVAIKNALHKTLNTRIYNIQPFVTGSNEDVTITVGGIAKTLNSTFTDSADFVSKIQPLVTNATITSTSPSTIKIESGATLGADTLKKGVTDLSPSSTGSEEKESLECIFDRLSELEKIKDALYTETEGHTDFTVPSTSQTILTPETYTLDGITATSNGFSGGQVIANAFNSLNNANITAEFIAPTTVRFNGVRTSLTRAGQPAYAVSSTVQPVQGLETLEEILKKQTLLANGNEELKTKLDAIVANTTSIITEVKNDLQIIEGYDDLGNTDGADDIPILKVFPTEDAPNSSSNAIIGTPFFRRNDATQAIYTLVGNFAPKSNQSKLETTVTRFRYSGVNTSQPDLTGGTITIPQDNQVLEYIVTKDGVLFSKKYVVVMTPTSREIAFANTANEVAFVNLLKKELTTPDYYETARFHVLDTTPGATLGKVKRTIIQYYNEENRTRYKTVDQLSNTFATTPLSANEVAVNVNNYVTETFYNIETPKTLNSDTYSFVNVSVNPIINADGTTTTGEVEIYYNNETTPKFTLKSTNPILTFPNTGFNKNIISSQFIKIQPKQGVSYNYEAALPSNAVFGDPTLQLNKYWFDSTNAVTNAVGEVTQVNLPTSYGTTAVLNSTAAVGELDTSYAGYVGVREKSQTALTGQSIYQLSIPAINLQNEWVEIHAIKFNFDAALTNFSARLGVFTTGHSLIALGDGGDTRGIQFNPTVTNGTNIYNILPTEFNFTVNELNGTKPFVIKVRQLYQVGSTTERRFELWVYNTNNPNGKLVLGSNVASGSVNNSATIVNYRIDQQTAYFVAADLLSEEDRIIAVAKTKIGLV